METLLFFSAGEVSTFFRQTLRAEIVLAFELRLDEIKAGIFESFTSLAPGLLTEVTGFRLFGGLSKGSGTHFASQELVLETA